MLCYHSVVTPDRNQDPLLHPLIEQTLQTAAGAHQGQSHKQYQLEMNTSVRLSTCQSNQNRLQNRFKIPGALQPARPPAHSTDPFTPHPHHRPHPQPLPPPPAERQPLPPQPPQSPPRSRPPRPAWRQQWCRGARAPRWPPAAAALQPSSPL